LERSAWDFSHATRITLLLAAITKSQKFNGILRVDENDTLHAVLRTLVVDKDAPVAVTLNLCTDDAHRSTKVLAAEHLQRSSLIDGVAIAQVSHDTVGLRSLGTVVLAVEGVLEHEATLKGREGVLVLAHGDRGGSVTPIVRAVAVAIAAGGIGVAHSTNLQIQTGSLGGIAYAVCRRLP